MVKRTTSLFSTVFILALTACTGPVPNTSVTENTFSVKDLSVSYEARKLRQFIDSGQGANLVKELLYNKTKNPGLISQALDSDSTLFAAIESNDAVRARIAIDPGFSSFIEGLRPVPEPLRIAFQSRQEGNNEIYVMNADLTGIKNVSGSTFSDSAPNWILGGKRLAFTSNRDGGSDRGGGQIFTVKPDGTDIMRLTDPPSSSFRPVSSPDGKKIAFLTNKDNAFRELYIMDTDGKHKKRLTNNSSSESSYVWSKDGTKIAFGASVDGQNEIFVINSDGSQLKRLTNNSVNDYDPRWSPADSKILFSSDGTNGADLYVIDASGTGLVRLGDNPSEDFLASWAPDGHRIVYTSRFNDIDEICTIKPDGTDFMRLTETPVPSENYFPVNQYPVFSPDSSRIAYAASAVDITSAEIWIMDENGNNKQKLTSDFVFTDTLRVFAISFGWSPDGKILFYDNISTPVEDTEGSESWEGSSKFFQMDADGGGRHELAPGYDANEFLWSKQLP
jgi:Tol biopolymer transport system component